VRHGRPVVRCPRVTGRDVGADGFQTLGSLLPRRIAETRVYRKLKPERSGDEVRPRGRVNL
jgi:hypothetical protein